MSVLNQLLAFVILPNTPPACIFDTASIVAFPVASDLIPTASFPGGAGRKGKAVDLSAFADHLAGSYIPNTVIVDATASDTPPEHYLEWMQKGINIITPNKKMSSGPLERYSQLKKLQRESYIHYFHEVGFSATSHGTSRCSLGYIGEYRRNCLTAATAS